MQISEAKNYIGMTCEIVSHDRHGNELREVAEILDVLFIPMYGASIITDCGEVVLDRVGQITPRQAAAA